MEEENISVEQRVAKGGTANGVVNNYYGMTPSEAMRMTMELFQENFPKLQAQALETVNERANELREEIFKKIEEQRITDLTPFSEPDVQYMLCESQKNYARFGTSDMLDKLSTLLVNRIQHDEEFALKVAIDKAISIVSFISEAQLDLLSLIFLTKLSRRLDIKTLDELKEYLNVIADKFSHASSYGYSALESQGCIRLRLISAAKSIAEAYGFTEEVVKEILPEKLEVVHPDYGLTDVGIVLAVLNAERKQVGFYDLHIWVHE